MWFIRLLAITASTLQVLCSSLAAQVDDSWTVTANGQTIQANPDGSFRIPNVPAVDISPVDFVGDNPLRITGVRTVNGKTEYLFSNFFTIRQRETAIVPELSFTDLPPLTSDFIRISIEEPNRQTLTKIGQTTQLTVTAYFDGTPSDDVTSSQAWTSYRSSSDSVVTVSRDGLVTATGEGIAVITAQNDGAVAVKTIRVLLDETPLTTVVGFIETSDGTSAPGLGVVTNLGQSSFSEPDGSFELRDVPTSLGEIVVTLGAPTAVAGRVTVRNVQVGGISDAGVIQTVAEVLLRNGDVFQPGELSLECCDVVVRNARITMNGEQRFRSLTLESGSTITHTVGDENGTRIFVSRDMRIDETSGIVASESGYGIDAGPGRGPRGAGGGYGGRGGNNGAGELLGGGPYGSAEEPQDLGSGGGSANGLGGRGGGLIVVNVQGVLTVSGLVASNGWVGGGTGTLIRGGGSGGSINIRATRLEGAGTIEAMGGDAGAAGAGAGGRIAIRVESNVFEGNVAACGGVARSGGGAGTVFVAVGDSAPITTISNCGGNGGVTPVDGEHTFANLRIAQGAIVTHSSGFEGGLVLNVEQDLEVDFDSYIDVTAAGFDMDNGPGRGPRGSGGGYGGTGGFNGAGSLSGGFPYGSVDEPVDFGSGGGSSNGQGGRGGGLIRITVGNILRVDGGILANGGIGGGTGTLIRGGGSGGTINIRAATLVGSGQIRALGGDAGAAGAGGGGRIAIRAGTNDAFAGEISACGGNALSGGGAGTLFVSVSDDIPVVTIANCGGNGGITTLNGDSTFTNLIVQSGAILSHSSGLEDGMLLHVEHDLLIAEGSYIDVSGAGYTPNSGPGGGTEGSGDGAAYGGRGSSPSGVNPTGLTYGFAEEPQDLGSGGGTYVGTTGAGSGGGLVFLNVGGRLTVEGGVLANGGASSGVYATRRGGGSGGSVNIRTGSLEGSGRIEAAGGNAGGGGGGGRIAIRTGNNAFSGQVNALGGTGRFVTAGEGTVLFLPE